MGKQENHNKKGQRDAGLFCIRNTFKALVGGLLAMATISKLIKADGRPNGNKKLAVQKMVKQSAV